MRLLDDAALQAADPPDRPPLVICQTLRTGKRGRPRIEIDKSFLQEGIQLRGNVGVALAAGCSARSVRRRALGAGIVTPGSAPFRREVGEQGDVVIRQAERDLLPAERGRIGNDELDRIVQDALQQFPNFGRAMLDGALRMLRKPVGRARITASYLRVHGAPRIFGDRRIARRTYRVAGANSLWHHDGQHGEC